jgi:hypothetical protein
MGKILALMLLAGLYVSLSEAGDKTPLAPSHDPPEGDVRMAKLTGAQPQKIGLLTYYPNRGGGYTFLERGRVVFYALPSMPATCQFDRIVQILGTPKGQVTPRNVVERINVPIIGTSKMPVGGQTLYRGELHTYFNVFVRDDIPIAQWSRDTPDAEFRLSMMAEDHETRLKLKSIVRVLEGSPRP